MDLRRVVQASSLLMIISTLACGVLDTPLPPPPSPASQPVVTLPPETPTLETANTQEAPVVQIGFFDSLYLRYDPEEWEPNDETPDQALNQKGEPIQRLQHRTISGCILHENLGRGAPPSWELKVTARVIGGLEYRVETWTETEVQKPVLVVYQYRPDEATIGKRIELVIDRQPEECIQKAEAVLVLSADLISGPP